MGVERLYGELGLTPKKKGGELDVLAGLAQLREVLDALPNSREELEAIVDVARRLLAEMDDRLASADTKLAEQVAREVDEARAELAATAKQGVKSAESAADRAAGEASKAGERAADAVAEVRRHESELRDRLAEFDQLLVSGLSSLQGDWVDREQVNAVAALVQEKVEQVERNFADARGELERAVSELRTHVDWRIQGVKSAPPTPTKIYQDGVLVGERRGVNFTGATVTDNGSDRVTVAITAGGGTVDAVSNVAQDRILGRITAGSGNSEELTAAQARTLLNVEDGATNDQTAAEILAALLTVDGAGSGLDADLLDGQSSAAFQPVDSDLTAIAALSTTAFGRSFLDRADAAAGRTLLGLGTAATSASGDFQPVDSDLTAIAALTTTAYGRSVLEAANAAALRTLAGVVIGTNVQAWDADLDTLAANNAGTTTWLAALLNGTYVALTGDQTVAGVKTFSSGIRLDQTHDVTANGIASGSHPVRFRSTGSSATTAPSDVGDRKGLMVFKDTKTDDVDGACIVIDVIQTSNAGAATIKKTGLQASAYTLADNGGDTSAVHAAQYGGGYGLTAYKISATNRGAGFTERATDGHAAEFGITDAGSALSLQVGGRDAPHAGQGLMIQINNVFGKGIVVQPRDGSYDDREAFVVGAMAMSATNAPNPTTSQKFLITLEGAYTAPRGVITGAGQSAASYTTARTKNEKWYLRVSATGGTFTLTVGADTTTAIAYDATPATVQAALEALASVGGSGNVRVLGGQGTTSKLAKQTNGLDWFYPTFTIEFIGAKAATNMSDITSNPASLTGGAGTATLTKIQDGVAGAVQGGSLLLHDSSSNAGNGGVLLFGASTLESSFAAIKGVLANNANNSTGQLAFFTRASTTDAALTERARFTAGGVFQFQEGVNIQVGTSTGTRIGTGTTQKIGFYNATPIVQPAAYTQTYSTADRTHGTPTAGTLTDNSGGTANTTLEALTSGTVYATDVGAIRNNFADLAAMCNKLTADHLDLAQLVNSLIDDHQALGLAS